MGCGGRVLERIPEQRPPGIGFFYGVRPAWRHLWRPAVDVYADNSYFDASRERRFRVTVGRVQHDGRGDSDGQRFRGLGLEVAPWRRTGRDVLVCLQSDEFMATVADAPGWRTKALRRIAEVTDRPIVLRAKGDPTPLAAALRDAWIVVTWSSAAAVQALLAGVPVCVSAQSCAARFSTPVTELETPRLLDGREVWAAVLADNEWSLDEMRDGTCWRALNA